MTCTFFIPSLCLNWALKVRHGIPVLSLLMQDDQLAHLYIIGFLEYNKRLEYTV
jgi:hypothetical protein